MNKNFLKFFNIIAGIFILVNIPIIITQFSFLSSYNVVTIDELPYEFQDIIKEYKEKASKNGVETDIIDKMKYIVYKSKKVSHQGFGFYNTKYMGINLGYKTTYLQKKALIWHEFGHIILGYGHELSHPHFMNYSTKVGVKNIKELEESYFEKKVSFFNIKSFFHTNYIHAKHFTKK